MGGNPRQAIVAGQDCAIRVIGRDQANARRRPRSVAPRVCCRRGGRDGEAGRGTRFWVTRFIVAFVVAAAVLFAVHLVKGYGLQDSIGFGVVWGVVAAAIYTAIGYFRYRRNPACMLPRRKAP